MRHVMAVILFLLVLILLLPFAVVCWLVEGWRK